MNTTKPLVLIIEDEDGLRRFLRAALTSHDYAVLEASTLREGLALATSHAPALILLDLGLPDGDGIDFTRELRGWTKTPIVVISARGREDDKVSALDAGADDYLTKPFGVNELLARVRVALRHALAPSANTPIIYDFGPLHIDVAKREVRLEEHEIRLTPIEYKLLLLLAEHAGKVLTHRQILEHVWGKAYTNQTHTLRVHMAELRKKIEPMPAKPRWLLTEQGVGYRFRD